MSTAEDDFRAQLIGDATLTALVGRRVAQNAMPEGTPPPYVAFTTATSPLLGLDGTSFGNQVTVSCECWAANALAADEVADAVTAALAAGPLGQATVTARASGYDGDLGLDATVLSIDFWTD